MTYEIPSPEGECILCIILPECPCLNQYSIVASALYIMKLLYNSTVSMATHAISLYSLVLCHCCFRQSMVLRRSQKEISKSDRFLYILSTIMSVGEYDKVVQGVFENYPNMKYRDPSMRMVSMAW